jgi:hypothetical protein
LIHFILFSDDQGGDFVLFILFYFQMIKAVRMEQGGRQLKQDK